MQLIYLMIIFLVIILGLTFKRPLYQAIILGIFFAVVLYKIPLPDFIQMVKDASLNSQTIYLLLAFYIITYLQRMMENKNMLMLAERSLEQMFHSKRINAMVAPFIVGLLPSPGAVLIAAPIVDAASDDKLNVNERTFVASYYRHISELFMPTYASILLALKLTGVDMTAFVISMIPMVFVLFLLGFIFYVRKIPKNTNKEKNQNKKDSVYTFFKALWPIALTTLLILVLKIQVFFAVLPAIIIMIFIHKFKFSDLKTFAVKAFDAKMFLTLLVVMIFKTVLEYTHVIETLPNLFGKLPIPITAVFSIIIFLGTIVAGSQAIIAMILPIAFSTIPNAGLGELVLFMSISYIASQVSPTHICLAIITEHYKTSLLSLVIKTLPIIISFIGIAFAYSYILIKFIGG
ncbi:DUF401 family protein [Treponema denticola]|uniref:DUF401 family protein n=1 Tax=Treponema denticola TaxID=158 RepID=UPI0002B5C9A1|nr:DUF401 family protein [Treponema denticola]EMB26370.1 hypothetical protein HMPREF9724_00347 [Treponema denticola SP37]EPF33894.1 hypothetical protein HMPREF9734_01460 [Treponema denticola SP44]EPF39396.1 hypothetical protein HMPREF9731_01197 [Treponema denticola SP23]